MLAKVDIDSNPNLAQQHRVMSIPFVKGFRDGQVVAEFVGLQPPPAIDAFIDKLVPSETDRLVGEGDEASLREAVEREPGHVGARVALGRLLLDEGRAGEVAEIVEPVGFDQNAAALLSRVRLAAVDQPDVQAGLAALDRGQTEQGLTHLIDAVRVADPDLREDLRQAMLGVFAELGEHHPLAVRFRRRLAQALYWLPPPAKPETQELFSGLAGPAYSRRAAILSLGQEPRWHRFLASRLRARPDDRVLDVATGTGAVAAELAYRHGYRVTGIDQSDEMLASARALLAARGLGDRVELVRGEAEALPFEDASFDGLTVTYLLRYVADPAATLAELARVVRPGGTLASLEFGVPPWAAGARGVAALHGRAAAGGRPAWWAGVPGGGRGGSCTRASPTSTGATRSPSSSTSTARPACATCACGA